MSAPGALDPAPAAAAAAATMLADATATATATAGFLAQWAELWLRTLAALAVAIAVPLAVLHAVRLDMVTARLADPPAAPLPSPAPAQSAPEADPAPRPRPRRKSLLQRIGSGVWSAASLPSLSPPWRSSAVPPSPTTPAAADPTPVTPAFAAGREHVLDRDLALAPEARGPVPGEWPASAAHQPPPPPSPVSSSRRSRVRSSPAPSLVILASPPGSPSSPGSPARSATSSSSASSPTPSTAPRRRSSTITMAPASATSSSASPSATVPPVPALPASKGCAGLPGSDGLPPSPTIPRRESIIVVKPRLPTPSSGSGHTPAPAPAPAPATIPAAPSHTGGIVASLAARASAAASDAIGHYPAAAAMTHRVAEATAAHHHPMGQKIAGIVRMFDPLRAAAVAAPLPSAPESALPDSASSGPISPSSSAPVRPPGSPERLLPVRVPSPAPLAALAAATSVPSGMQAHRGSQLRRSSSSSSSSSSSISTSAVSDQSGERHDRGERNGDSAASSGAETAAPTMQPLPVGLAAAAAAATLSVAPPPILRTPSPVAHRPARGASLPPNKRKSLDPDSAVAVSAPPVPPPRLPSPAPGSAAAPPPTPPEPSHRHSGGELVNAPVGAARAAEPATAPVSPVTSPDLLYSGVTRLIGSPTMSRMTAYRRPSADVSSITADNPWVSRLRGAEHDPLLLSPSLYIDPAAAAAMMDEEHERNYPGALVSSPLPPPPDFPSSSPPPPAARSGAVATATPASASATRDQGSSNQDPEAEFNAALNRLSQTSTTLVEALADLQQAAAAAATTGPSKAAAAAASAPAEALSAHRLSLGSTLSMDLEASGLLLSLNDTDSIASSLESSPVVGLHGTGLHREVSLSHSVRSTMSISTTTTATSATEDAAGLGPNGAPLQPITPEEEEAARRERKLRKKRKKRMLQAQVEEARRRKRNTRWQHEFEDGATGAHDLELIQAAAVAAQAVMAADEAVATADRAHAQLVRRARARTGVGRRPRSDDSDTDLIAAAVAEGSISTADGTASPRRLAPPPLRVSISSVESGESGDTGRTSTPSLGSPPLTRRHRGTPLYPHPEGSIDDGDLYDANDDPRRRSTGSASTGSGGMYQYSRDRYSDTSMSFLEANYGADIRSHQLFLDGAQISQLPDGVFRDWSHLTVLDLSSNKLSSLPASLARLVNLQELVVRENRLQELPVELCALDKLVVLDVSINELQRLDHWIHELKLLEILDARTNQLIALPPELGLLSHLHTLLLDNNPLEAPYRDLAFPLQVKTSPSAACPNPANCPEQSPALAAIVDVKRNTSHSSSVATRSTIGGIAMASTLSLGDAALADRMSLSSTDSRRSSRISVNSTASAPEPGMGKTASPMLLSGDAQLQHHEQQQLMRSSLTSNDSGIAHSSSVTSVGPESKLSAALSLSTLELPPSSSSSGMLRSAPAPLDKSDTASLYQKDLPSLPALPQLGGTLGEGRQRAELAELALDSDNEPIGASVALLNRKASLDLPSADTSRGRSATASAARSAAGPLASPPLRAIQVPGSASGRGRASGRSISVGPKPRSASLAPGMLSTSTLSTPGLASTPVSTAPSRTGSMGIPKLVGMFKKRKEATRGLVRRHTSRRSSKDGSGHGAPSASPAAVASGAISAPVDEAESLLPFGGSYDDDDDARSDATIPTHHHHHHDPTLTLAYAAALQRLLGYLRDVYDLMPEHSESDQVRAKIREMTVKSEQQQNSGPSKAVAAAVAAATGKKPADPVVRKHIVAEIVSTEETYVQELAYLVKCYAEPMVSQGLLSPEESKLVFSNVESILSFHQGYFLGELKAAGDMVGRVFAKHSAYLKMYSVFINAFDKGMQEFEKWAGKRKKLRAFLARCPQDPAHHQLNFQAYLILPIQRIPRYRLLLLDLLKHTPPGHEDHRDLLHALGEVERRASEINERKRDQENMEQLLAIHAKMRASHNLTAPLVQPHRRFIREGELMIVRFVKLTSTSGHGGSGGALARRSGGSSRSQLALREMEVRKTFTFFLFNDIMIQCKREGDKFDPWRALKLTSRVAPASLTPDGYLRVADESVVLYLSSTDLVLRNWMSDINSRYLR
ncbi:hypothetical protein H9P43_010164 [Blastocladiella emersonii ATCC 22665]|nr:hypothetical protein H9P43_010164 [Blastocladiella emersonii ATCC 22665]